MVAYVPLAASPLSSDIPKPYGSTEKVVKEVNRAFALPVPAFSDLGKAANDVRDFERRRIWRKD